MTLIHWNLWSIIKSYIFIYIIIIFFVYKNNYNDIYLWWELSHFPKELKFFAFYCKTFIFQGNKFRWIWGRITGIIIQKCILSQQDPPLKYLCKISCSICNCLFTLFKLKILLWRTSKRHSLLRFLGSRKLESPSTSSARTNTVKIYRYALPYTWSLSNQRSTLLFENFQI